MVDWRRQNWVSLRIGSLVVAETKEEASRRHASLGMAPGCRSTRGSRPDEEATMLFLDSTCACLTQPRLRCASQA